MSAIRSFGGLSRAKMLLVDLVGIGRDVLLAIVMILLILIVFAIDSLGNFVLDHPAIVTTWSLVATTAFLWCFLH